jgi:hypothetical protein
MRWELESPKAPKGELGRVTSQPHCEMMPHLRAVMVWEGVVLVWSSTQAVFGCAVPIGLTICLQLVL